MRFSLTLFLSLPVVAAASLRGDASRMLGKAECPTCGSNEECKKVKGQWTCVAVATDPCDACESGEVCVSISGSSFCATACTVDSCPTGYSCESSICVPESSCTIGSDCSSGEVCAEGVCIPGCPADSCGEGESCYTVDTISTCYPDGCKSNDDCGTGQECVPVDGVTPEYKLCEIVLECLADGQKCDSAADCCSSACDKIDGKGPSVCQA